MVGKFVRCVSTNFSRVFRKATVSLGLPLILERMHTWMSHTRWRHRNRHSLCYIEKTKTSSYDENPTFGTYHKITNNQIYSQNMQKNRHHTVLPALTGIIWHQPTQNRHELAPSGTEPAHTNIKPTPTSIPGTNRHNQHHPAPIRKNIQ